MPALPLQKTISVCVSVLLMIGMPALQETPDTEYPDDTAFSTEPDAVLLSGTPTVGSTLVASATFDAGEEFEWYLDDAQIPGATSASYTPGPDDQGGLLRACAHPLEDDDLTVCSAPATIGFGAQHLSAPKIVGTVAALKTVKVAASGWVGQKQYQWYVGGKAVGGAAGKQSSLKLTTKHIGKKVQVRVTNTRAGYQTKSLSSASRKVTKAVLRAPTPKIAGTKAPGRTLTAKAGSWTKGTKLKYRWYVNGKAVKGATKKRFKLTAKHGGKKVQVRVTGSKKLYGTAKRASAKVSIKRTREQEVLRLVNQARSKARYCGAKRMPAVKSLKLDAKLSTAARRHGADMAKYNYFSHYGRNGSTPWDRAKRAGTSARGENIAAGHAGAKATVDQWLNSPGHCVNLMTPSHKVMGIGRGANSKSTYRYYWVQMFR